VEKTLHLTLRGHTETFAKKEDTRLWKSAYKNRHVSVTFDKESYGIPKIMTCAFSDPSFDIPSHYFRKKPNTTKETTRLK